MHYGRIKVDIFVTGSKYNWHVSTILPNRSPSKLIQNNLGSMFDFALHVGFLNKTYNYETIATLSVCIVCNLHKEILQTVPIN